jgi:hypothetical protein
VLPGRLIVYHAGTGRSVFLGCLRVTTIFMFSFFSLVVAPTYWYAEGDQKWVAAGSMFPSYYQTGAICSPVAIRFITWLRMLHVVVCSITDG